MSPRASSRALAALLAGLACTLGGCGAAGSSTPALPDSAAAIRVGTALAGEQVLTRSLDDEPRSIDPQLTDDVPGQRVADDLFEGLTTVGMDGRAVPGVAESWQSSADGLTWTFHLRPQARWSNGAPITAQDFVYSWRRELDPDTGAQYAQALAPLRNALAIASGKAPPETLGARALDAHTLRVELSGPTPYLLDLLSQQYLYPVFAPVIRRWGDGWIRPEHIVSNGPFILRERVIGNRITLERNPYYWDAAHVRLQRVVYYVIPDRNVQVERFLAAGVQWTDSYAANEYSWLKPKLGAQVTNSPYFGTYMLGFNMAGPPFKDNYPLREALVLAIDREPLVHSMRQIYQPAYTLMPPLPGYTHPTPPWHDLSDQARHALARRLYRQAGYSAAHPLHLDLDTSIQGADERHFYEAVAAEWHAILGADVHVEEREFKVLIQDRELHKLPLFHDAWIGDYPDPYTFMQIFYTGNGNNNEGYSNPRIDHLVDAAGQEHDAAARYRLFEQAERVLNEDAAYVPLYFYATRHLVKPYVRGWQSNVMDRNLSRYMYLLVHQGA